MPSSRTIFLDVDGTILAGADRIAPSTIDAIRAARARGHQVFLCTGRSASDISPAVADIGFDGAITNSGAFAIRDGELILSRTMTRADAERLIDFFRGHGMEFFLQANEGVYASDGAHAMVTSGRDDADKDSEPAPVIRHRPLAEADLSSIAKASFASADPDGLTLAQTELGDRFHVISGSIPLPGGSNGEASLHGTNKGTAITHVMDALGLDQPTSVGIGDSWNDVEMFDVVGTSVAMGNADPELQRLADRVTTAVLDDGVWNAFSELGLL
ncbi:Cof-type HAD-IIB family hydrolase [Nigerium massiliense]|uniref:Cof-type HAD-IIB family hydrolase n=1 Tax=Nigerium massiliense TaxID=1522317 RepID=UPI00058DA23D|nr:Cof-type HAD-IIB family hydrolase [Nigerium massiliense]